MQCAHANEMCQACKHEKTMRAISKRRRPPYQARVLMELFGKVKQVRMNVQHVDENVK